VGDCEAGYGAHSWGCCMSVGCHVRRQGKGGSTKSN
jgi:hypothetical protein